MASAPRWPAGLALASSVVGFAFAASSTLDYVAHLDRQVHDLHCSFVPGLGGAQGADTACRAAMYSPYAAVFREAYWGGVPIALFAVGAFGFYVAFSLYLLLSGPRAPRRAAGFFGLVGLLPLAASAVMFVVSLVKLGQFCKTCVGIYVSSVALAIAAVSYYRAEKAAALAEMRSPTATVVDGEEAARRAGGPLLVPAWLLALAAFALVPALLYVSSLPSYASYVGTCGKLEKPDDPGGVLIHAKPAGATQQATLVVNPLCPTCKAFDQRLASDGVLDQLDATIVLFPLDTDCNWMLDRSVHPGSCMVSRAVLCGEHRSRQVLEWAYEKQEQLLEGAKAGAGTNNVHSAISERWPELVACVDAKATEQRLTKMLRWIVNNHLQVSTPQLFLGDQRLCDEDTDIGLPYALHRLAPGLKKK